MAATLRMSKHGNWDARSHSDSIMVRATTWNLSDTLIGAQPSRALEEAARGLAGPRALNQLEDHLAEALCRRPPILF